MMWTACKFPDRQRANMSYLWHLTPSLCIYIWKPLGSIRRHTGLLEWKINGHKHSLWEKTASRGCAFTARVQVDELLSQKRGTSDVREWVIGVSPLSTAVSLWCGFQRRWKDWPSQRQEEMQTLPIFFYSRVWNIKWSFNDSYVHLSRNLTALKIRGRGWSTDKWRAGGIYRSWVKTEGVHFLPDRIKASSLLKIFD